MDEKEPGALGRGHWKAYKMSGVIFMYSFTQQMLNEVPLCDILVGTPQRKRATQTCFQGACIAVRGDRPEAKKVIAY